MLRIAESLLVTSRGQVLGSAFVQKALAGINGVECEVMN